MQNEKFETLVKLEIHFTNKSSVALNYFQRFNFNVFEIYGHINHKVNHVNLIRHPLMLKLLNVSEILQKKTFLDITSLKSLSKFGSFLINSVK